MLQSWPGTATSFVTDVLGRIFRKTASVLTFFRVLHPWAAELRDQLDPYRSMFSCIPRPLSNALRKLGSMRLKTDVPNRIPVSEHAGRFGPRRELCDSSSTAYVGTIRISSRPRRNNLLEFLRIGQATFSVFAKYDASSVLIPFPAASVHHLFPVWLGFVDKDEWVDRSILICTKENGRKESLEIRMSAELPHGTRFCEFDLEGGKKLRFCAEDPKEYYPSWMISSMRGLTNTVQHAYELGDFEGIRARALFKAMFSCKDSTKVIGAQGHLAQGDLKAPDFGEEANIGIGLEVRAVEVADLLAYRKPIPRGPFKVGFMMDDLVTSLGVPPGRPARLLSLEDGGSPARDLQCVQRIGLGYVVRRLTRHLVKAKQRTPEGVFWGRYGNGDVGR